MADSQESAAGLVARFESKEALIGIIGLGYVGLPLGHAFCSAGFRVLGFDVDPAKIARLRAGESYIDAVPSAAVEAHIAAGLFDATADLGRLDEPDAILICVPTPLNKNREPDLSYVESTTRSIAERLRPGQLVVLESTTYPGTTAEVMTPILEAGGLRVAEDFFLAFSPERENPGDPKWRTKDIPKVVGADDPASARAAAALYTGVVTRVVPVSNARTAEATKLLENIYRAVNIALVNELKVLFERMDIDIFEVIEASKTKPFGFTAFYPGPGLGGHCIPLDPFYLSWKAREFETPTRFIELAGEVNAAMPRYVIERCQLALNKVRKAINGAKILVLGVAYKKNVDDLRESPSLIIIDELRKLGAEVSYHDPHVPSIMKGRRFDLSDLRSVALEPVTLAAQDLVVILTDHDAIDIAAVAAHAALIVDTRGATRALDPAAINADVVRA